MKKIKLIQLEPEIAKFYALLNSINGQIFMGTFYTSKEVREDAERFFGKRWTVLYGYGYRVIPVFVIYTKSKLGLKIKKKFKG